jgi:hypothetical protein
MDKRKLSLVSVSNTKHLYQLLFESQFLFWTFLGIKNWLLTPRYISSRKCISGGSSGSNKTTPHN